MIVSNMAEHKNVNPDIFNAYGIKRQKIESSKRALTVVLLGIATTAVTVGLLWGKILDFVGYGKNGLGGMIYAIIGIVIISFIIFSLVNFVFYTLIMTKKIPKSQMSNKESEASKPGPKRAP